MDINFPRQKAGRIISLSPDGKTPSETDVDRAGGEPIGMTKETWPRFDDKPMVHVVTVARENIARELPASIGAAALFTNELLSNEFFSANIRANKVVLLSPSDLERGTTPARDVLGQALPEPLPVGSTLIPETIEYDLEALKAEAGEFTRDKSLEELSELNISLMLEETILERLNASGCVSSTHHWWLQYREARVPRMPLFVFNHLIAPDINLGDMGVMYALTHPDGTNPRALWQG